jgi:dihydroorotase
MTRRSLISTAALPLLAQRPASRQRPYDILIRGGEVCDPSRGFRKKTDLAIADGRIAAIEDAIDPARGIDVIDATGLFVTPGLVDLHTHVHTGLGTGIDADKLAATSGTTTWVDAGTFAHNEAAGFRRFIVNPAQVRIYGYVYLYPTSRDPDIDPVKHVRAAMRATGEVAQANRDIILGVKFQAGSNMNGRWSLEFLKIARELCEKYQLPLLLHISFAPPETDQVMPLVRPGDVVTHCFNTHTLGILDGNGKIRGSVLDARARGVLFDVGHGAGSFNFAVARKALDQGFLPDSISSDVHSSSINGPAWDMPTTMAKLMYLGMSFEDVLLRSTTNPAKVVNRLPGMGTLTVGGPADVALLEMREGSFQLTDAQRNPVTVQRRLFSRLTICRGKRLIAI